MKVSAVIPTYNRRAYIQRALDSVFSQTVPVDEVIIVDDENSTDGLTEAVAGWYGSRVRVLRQGGGLSGARRRGVQEARGEWIAFLDSDDEWTPERNRQFLEAAANVPRDVAWIFGDLRIVTDAGDGLTLFQEFGLTVEECPQIFAESLTVQFPFQFGLLQGSLIRRSALLDLDCFNEGLQHSEDLLTGFQVACQYKFAAIQQIVGKYFRTSDLNDNSALLKGLQGEDYFRSRMLCFALVIQNGHRTPWNKLYASAARELCRVRARRGQPDTRLAFEQFRFGGVSAKGVAFFCAAILGRSGVRAWDALADLRRKIVPEAAETQPAGGLQAAVRSAVKASGKV